MGGAALLAGIYTIWQHSKNPNGQARFGYGLVSVLAGGAFLTASLFATSRRRRWPAPGRRTPAPPRR